MPNQSPEYRTSLSPGELQTIYRQTSDTYYRALLILKALYHETSTPTPTPEVSIFGGGDAALPDKPSADAGLPPESNGN